MLSPIEETLLKEFLAQIPYPEQSLSYNELMGYMFGLAITPARIPEKEWITAIFSDDADTVPAEDQARGMQLILSQVFETFIARKLRGELHFPYQVENLLDKELQEVLEWSAGFEDALALRPEIWEPPQDSQPERDREELFFALMVLQGLNDPAEIMPFFQKIPADIFAETFTSFNPDDNDRELQVQAFLIATLPLAIQTLQEYGARLEKNGLPDKQKNSGQDKSAPSPNPIKKAGTKGKVIKVDFINRKKQ